MKKNRENTHKIKILFLIHTLGGGGAERVLVDIVNKLDNTKFDITVMTVINTGIYIKYLAKHVKYKSMFDLPCFLTSGSSSGSLLSNSSLKTRLAVFIYQTIWKFIPCRLIYKKFIKDKFDTEVAFLEGVTSKIIACSTNKKSKKIAWIHVDFENEHKSKAVFLSNRSERRCYNSFDQIVCVSDITRRGFKKTVKSQKDPITILNFIDAHPLVKLSDETKIVKNDSFTISVIGRLTHQKGQDRLLKAVARLKREGLCNYKVLLVGDGCDFDKLQRYAVNNQLDNVYFLGYRTNRYDIILQSDLCFITSRAEGFSTVMAEAILLSKPILTTSVSGTDWLPSELVIDNNEHAIYQALEKIIIDGRYYKTIVANNKELKSKFLEINSNIIKKLEEILI